MLSFTAYKTGTKAILYWIETHETNQYWMFTVRQELWSSQGHRNKENKERTGGVQPGKEKN